MSTSKTYPKQSKPVNQPVPAGKDPIRMHKSLAMEGLTKGKKP